MSERLMYVDPEVAALELKCPKETEVSFKRLKQQIDD